MDKIEDVRIQNCTESKYIKPLKIHYKQNHESRSWDIIKEHDDVAIFVYNKTRKVIVMVKQFRPAIYINNAQTEEKEGKIRIDTEKYPGSLGITWELCAGIVDKQHSTQEIAQMELLEECGYKVPLDSIEKVASYRTGVGTTGSQQTLFYVEVTDAMRVSQGGGVAEEGEMIDVAEIPVGEGQEFMVDDSKVIPLTALYAFTWFYNNKYAGILSQSNLS